ncbi:acyl-CoA dehydrogenase [Amylibacter marinus]|uniref:Acyl-CoA dehydrogenase n=1 Tax=Amylibacter marinus TaxID=1475483 RepID=A0ABQ5VY70_9RHOB|nr:acyl-CoA dehydrogenase [Amylibacter marinus]GLQ36234.1 acyl-CoA dehydrogenase [Amylibacter marinus]
MYDPSENDLSFAIKHGLDAEMRALLETRFDLGDDLVDAVLSEAGRVARDVIAPLNQSGDITGSVWNSDFTVTTPAGFKEAHRAMAEGGWCGIEAGEEHGGQGMSKVISTSVAEMWHGANMAFALCSLLSQGQIHALEVFGTPAQKATYLPKLASGAWTGTMNLTEPQAGTDLGALKTSAKPDKDGEYRIKGQKIFITYGEHDMAENIVHLVLARVEGAPEGIKGISLFIVPKILTNEDGSLGARNDVKCVSLEHKLGINASPTAVLQFGEDEGAIGYLVGEENQGLSIMFKMMNHARFGVGVQGLAMANRAFMAAKAYAGERVQGIPLDGKAGDTIDRHPDVMRLLAGMRSEIEAMRGMMIYTAGAIDLADNQLGDTAYWQSRAELMIPILKAWLTERSVALASDGVQVHGGMGFIEETGAAQHYRDARILPIYEGTTAIQANDMMYRKTLRDQGVGVRALLADISASATTAMASDNSDISATGRALAAACETAEDALGTVLAGGLSMRHAGAVSVPYLMMLGTLTGGWMALRSASAAAAQAESAHWDATFLSAKQKLARVFADHSLPEVARYSQIIQSGGAAVENITPEML